MDAYFKAGIDTLKVNVLIFKNGFLFLRTPKMNEQFMFIKGWF